MIPERRNNEELDQIRAVLIAACHPEWTDYDMVLVQDILDRFFSRMAGLSFIHHCVLWTRAEEVIPIAQAHGFYYLPQEISIGRVSHRSHNLPASWKEEIGQGLLQMLGTVGNVQVYVDVAHVMLQAETVEEMFDVLMEDESIHDVVAAEITEPHLYLETPGGLRQLFDHPGLDRQKFPRLYRTCSAYIRHGLRPKPSLKKTKLFPVSWAEALTYNPAYSGFYKAS